MILELMQKKKKRAKNMIFLNGLIDLLGIEFLKL